MLVYLLYQIQNLIWCIFIHFTYILRPIVFPAQINLSFSSNIPRILGMIIVLNLHKMRRTKGIYVIHIIAKKKKELS